MHGERWGGSEELWSRTALRLVESGANVSVNVHFWQTPVRQVEVLAQAGCAVSFRKLSVAKRVINKVMRQPNTFYKWLDKNQPDFVVVSQGFHVDGCEYMEACAKRSIPYVSISQAAIETFWPHDSTIPRIAQAYENAVKCYFVSHNNVNLVRKQLATPLSQAKVIRNPYQVDYNAATRWPDSSKGFKVACVGRLEPAAKGQDVLFEVLAQEKWRQRPLSVTLFGSGVNADGLRNLQKMYCLENVYFGGFVNNIEEVWANHHALVLPSRYEGLPLAIVEAMLCGRPCITTDVSGNAELIEDNVEGFIAAAPSFKYLDEAMERAWQKREQWQEIGQAARRKVRQCVSADPVGDFTTELLSVISSGQKTPLILSQK